jgi:DNA-binding transcriptional LysR family regulator
MLRSGTPTASTLAILEWIAPTIGTPARRLFTRFFEEHDVAAPKRIIECSSLVATRGLLQLSDRAALLSASQIRSDIDSGQLAVLADALPGTARSIGLTTRADWIPTAIQEKFTRILRRLSSKQQARTNDKQ